MSGLNKLTEVVETLTLGVDNIDVYENAEWVDKRVRQAMIEDEAETTICAIRDILESNEQLGQK